MSIKKESKSSRFKKGILFSLVLLSVSTIVSFIFYSDESTKKSVTELSPNEKRTEPAVAIISIPEEYSMPTEGPKFRIHLPEEPKEHIEDALPFHPPIPALVQPAVVTRVNANIGQNINTAHQSFINIPPRAFVDKHGKIITGYVDVAIKEYYNHLDIFLSGIPMKYDSGSSEQLVSAGMIEITASQNNEEVFANKENKINVMMAALSGEPDYNVYYFDQKKKEWQYKGKDIVTPTSTGLTRTDKFFTDSVETKFKYNEPEFSIELLSNSDMDERRKNLLAKKKRPESFEFKLNPKKNSPPENKFIQSVRWTYTGQDAYDNYCLLLANPRQNQSLVKKRWKDVTIHRNESGSYFLKASNDSISISLEVLPSVKLKNAAAFEKKFLAYEKGRSDREEQERTAFQKFQADSSAYYAKWGKYNTKTVSYAQAINRSFQVDGMGIWNIDKPVRRPEGATVYAYFKDENGNEIKPDKVYLIEKNSNTVYNYFPSEFRRLKYNPSSENVMWTILPNGKFAYISAEEFKQYKTRGGTCVFKMKIDDVENPSRDYLKDKLKFS